MFRIPLLDSDRVLLLTPRWSELGTLLQVSLLALLCLAPIGLVVWLYRYELHLVKRGTAMGLLLLRLVVLFLLLTLVCLQPIYAHTTREDLTGRVIVAVDVSDSMGIRDPQRETVDKLRLARALKLAGDLCSAEQLDDWISQHAAKKPIQWVNPDEFRDEPERRRKAEEQRHKAHDAVCDRIDALTRSAIARQLLSREGIRLAPQIAAKHHLELISFAGHHKDFKPEQVEDIFKKNAPDKPDPKKLKEKPAEASRSDITDLGLPLRLALERSGAGRGKILGVVVLTDGQHNAGDSPVKRATTLKDQRIPLYPIALGGHKPPPDVAVLAMTAPPAAFKDVEVPVKVRFKVVGLKAQELAVKVHRPGEEDKPLEQRTIKHDGKDQEYVESFQVKLDKEGRQTVLATVRPVEKDTKEARLDNNQQSVIINVADEQSKVLLIDGEARWELHYLWQALLRDRSMKVSSVVFVQPRIGKVPEEELKKLNNPSLTLPPPPPADKPDQDELFNYDCIILGDVTPERLKREDRLRLQKYVADRGGTLVILAGKQGMPLAFGRAGSVSDRSSPLRSAPDANAPGSPGNQQDDGIDPLIKMLPIEEAKEVAPKEGFPITLTAEGREADFLRLEPEGGLKESLDRWAALPRHYWGVVGKAKKGATTLAYVAGDEKGLTPKEKRQREQDQALLVRHNYGFGRVFFVGLDSTWRWRWRTGDLYHHRFWSQTIRWAASDKPLVSGNKFVRFGTPQAVYAGSEPVKVMVRLSDEIKTLPEKLTAQARILRKDGDKKEVAVALVPLKKRAMQPRVLEGQLRNLPGGHYLIELVIPELADRLQPQPGTDGKAKPLRATFSVTREDSGEMLQLATNWTLLKELADKNGSGKVYTAENASELIDLLAQKAITKTDSQENKLWQWWVTLVLILALLTVEWATRKLSGLP